MLIDEHGEAIEYDLIGLGLRLRDCPSPAFNWRDLLVLCRRWGRESELYQALHPEDDTTWGVSEYILAHIADSTVLRLWQAAGGKTRRPEPIPRPGDTREGAQHYGTAEPVEDILSWLQDEFQQMTPEGVGDGLRRAREVRRLAATGMPRRDIAGRVGVSISTVGRIIRGDAWPDN